MSLSGAEYRIHYRIASKFRRAGATSRKKAITVKEAHLDLQEQGWLDYFVGGLAERIKKTGDRRYYVES